MYPVLFYFYMYGLLPFALMPGEVEPEGNLTTAAGLLSLINKYTSRHGALLSGEQLGG